MEISGACICSDEARRLVSCCTNLDLQNAVELGYVIEVYHWNETTQYNPKTEKGGLLSVYVNRFLRLKQMASGWPKNYESENAKQSYIDNYKGKAYSLINTVLKRILG